MPNLTIEIPDDLARNLAAIAAAQHKSVQEVAVEGLRSLTNGSSYDAPSGSAPAVLRAMLDAPHLGTSDVDALEAAIASGRIPVQVRELFPD